MLRTLQQHYAQLWNGTPGKRFMQYYQRRQQKEKEHLWKAALYIALGSILMLIGLAFAALPVFPGFLLMVPGLALLSARVQMIARCLDRVELLIRQRLHRSRQDSGLV